MSKLTKPITKKEMDSLLNEKNTQMKLIRVFDFASSGMGLIFLSPMLLIVSLLIKLDSKGPILYRQERVGKDGKLFKINKFRSMVTTPVTTGSLITTKDDQRITRLGKIIRKLKIDELPQLINVVLGEMSLVGPRPEVKKYVDHYDENALQVLRVRPGITDLASIAFFDESELLSQAEDIDAVYINQIMPLKHSLNYKYIRNMSLLYNIKVILKTFCTVIRRK